jgi:hypothetical protein
MKEQYRRKQAGEPKMTLEEVQEFMARRRVGRDRASQSSRSRKMPNSDGQSEWADGGENSNDSVHISSGEGSVPTEGEDDVGTLGDIISFPEEGTQVDEADGDDSDPGLTGEISGDSPNETASSPIGDTLPDGADESICSDPPSSPSERTFSLGTGNTSPLPRLQIQTSLDEHVFTTDDTIGSPPSSPSATSEHDWRETVQIDARGGPCPSAGAYAALSLECRRQIDFLADLFTRWDEAYDHCLRVWEIMKADRRFHVDALLSRIPISFAHFLVESIRQFMLDDGYPIE